jgi:acyl-homoserine-lactone acylase
MTNSIITIFFLLFLQKVQSQSVIDPNRIDIVRDSFGVPHIFAMTDPEVAYGLAWANAEDDFKSMQMAVLSAKNLMGKVLGKEGAAGDYAFALFRCREITEEKWNTLSAEFLQLLDGYIQGINNYAKKHPEEVLNNKIFPLTPQELVASSVLALTVFNGADDAMKNIFANTIPTLPELNKKGSNAIAVHPSKTTTGEAFLTINAHQPNTGPQAFYEAHVCSEDGWNALGGLLAGGTSILHGVNENLGWAHTVNYCDRMDVYQLEMNPENTLQYKFDGQWLTLEKKTIRLKIKGIPVTVKRNVYWSKYGATMKNKQGFFSIRLGANMEIRALEQWYKMNKAKNFTAFYQTISTPGLSMFNITYADKYDTIFYINNALMPVRDTSRIYNWKKTLPGNTSKTLWTAFRNIRELPQYINPKSGFLFNTNHSSFLATASSDNLKANQFSRADGWETWHNNRSARLLELMPLNNSLAYEDLKKIKFDQQLPVQLRYPYSIDSMLLLNPAENPDYASLINDFKSWDKKGDAGSKGAAIFLLAYLHLSKQLQGQDARNITKKEAIDTYQYIKDYMLKYFGRTDIVLGDLQKIVRGDKDWPLGGFPDLLSPQWTEKYKDGKLKSTGGDGLIMFIRFQKGNLPVIETVNMYGASAKAGSRHFDDQVEMYLQQKTKKMTLNKEEIYKKAERIYQPK